MVWREIPIYDRKLARVVTPGVDGTKEVVAMTERRPRVAQCDRGPRWIRLVIDNLTSHGILANPADKTNVHIHFGQGDGGING